MVAVLLVDAVPYGGKKKGADTGIDGLIYFKPDGRTTEKAIVSVKGGDNVSVPMIRDLGHVVGAEKAKIGLFVTLAAPTKPMQTEAVKAGYYENALWQVSKSSRFSPLKTCLRAKSRNCLGLILIAFRRLKEKR